MTLFKNYYQMFKATDEEIKDFFTSTILKPCQNKQQYNIQRIK